MFLHLGLAFLLRKWGRVVLGVGVGWGGTPGGSRGTAVQLVRGDGALEAGTAGEQVEGVPPSLLSGSWWASPILQGQVQAISKQWSPAPNVVNDRSSLLSSPGVHRSSPCWLPAGRHFLDKCPRVLHAMRPLHNPLKGDCPARRGDQLQRTHSGSVVGANCCEGCA